MSNKLFSIIIPCYNVEEYVAECLDSIINQTIGLDDIEIILVDDCSTDKTVEILNQYEQKYPENIMLVLLEQNGRQGHARNVGMQYASGDYICFIDSDDYVRLDMFAILKTIISVADLDVVQFRYHMFAPDDKPTYEIVEDIPKLLGTDIFTVYEYGKYRKQLLPDTRVLNESCTQKIYRRTMINKYGFQFMEGGAYEEPLFTHPIKYVVNNIAVLEMPLYWYRYNGEGTTFSYMTDPKTILDHINVQLILRQYMEETNLYKGYEDEADLYFIQAFYSEPFIFMKLRGWSMTVGVWRFLKKEVLNHFPNWESNPYIFDPALAKKKELFELLKVDEPDDDKMQKLIDDVVERLVVR